MPFPKRLALTIAAVVSMLAAADSARAAFFSCTPDIVGIFAKQRVHVRCATPAPPNSSIFYFAFSLKKKEAPLMVELFTAAKAQGKNVGIYYDPNDLSGEKMGCLTTDCRVFYGAEIRP